VALRQVAEVQFRIMAQIGQTGPDVH
jgi:hypothetical protein